MKNALAVFFVALPIAGTAYAQGGAPGGDRFTGIEVSTDPARAAEVERRAQEIAAHQQESTSGASGTSGTSAASAPTPGDTHKKSSGKKHQPHSGASGPGGGASSGPQ
ncbi:MAG: hypothetical protein V7642_6811 [Burkholderiales bacterium]